MILMLTGILQWMVLNRISFDFSLFIFDLIHFYI
nr:MAG TPA: hypothetical protein [Caudoviricetes sp.]